MTPSDIRAARLVNGWSKAEMSRRMGCHYTQISRWENGQADPSEQYIERLSQILTLSKKRPSVDPVNLIEIPNEGGLILKDLVTIWCALEAFRGATPIHNTPEIREGREHRTTDAQVKIRAMLKERGL